jgi:hypothetical protein
MQESGPAATGSEIVDLANQEQVAELVGDSVLRLWDVVNDLTRLRRTRRDDFRVTIFGSARVDPEHWVYGAVRDMAAELSRRAARS